MSGSDDEITLYNEHQLLALTVLQEELSIILSFMDATGLTEVEKTTYKSLSVITEILKQKHKRATLNIRRQVDNVVEVDFNSNNTGSGETKDDG